MLWRASAVHVWVPWLPRDGSFAVRWLMRVMLPVISSHPRQVSNFLCLSVCVSIGMLGLWGLRFVTNQSGCGLDLEPFAGAAPSGEASRDLRKRCWQEADRTPDACNLIPTFFGIWHLACMWVVRTRPDGLSGARGGNVNSLEEVLLERVPCLRPGPEDSRSTLTADSRARCSLGVYSGTDQQMKRFTKRLCSCHRVATNRETRTHVRTCSQRHRIAFSPKPRGFTLTLATSAERGKVHSAVYLLVGDQVRGGAALSTHHPRRLFHFL
ncbi:hypothetical protein EXIGLDRAFT_83275 [Exidia glandulosa HHB12029]|uniref:Uncharacterized protein n=1 Tax=Exidia glandulosa HHB12029 TaxID=1314781 RepID=A0A165HIZ9_EXIGL|nr:hypothetical protein EXIGLDRAFT_83275 [Exidia glandulosa HHB12029]